MVDAASGPVAKRVLAVGPGAPHHLLLPGFVDAQIGGVDEAAQDQVCEVLTEVVERHPAGGQEMRGKSLKEDNEQPQQQRRRDQEQRKLT